MCIRDSNYSKEIKLLKGNYPANSNEIIISKYYQTQNGVKVGDEITVKTGATQISDKFIETEQLESTAALPVKTFKVVGIYPVSYTHLDVYKRQVTMFIGT